MQLQRVESITKSLLAVLGELYRVRVPIKVETRHLQKIHGRRERQNFCLDRLVRFVEPVNCWVQGLRDQVAHYLEKGLDCVAMLGWVPSLVVFFELN